MTRIASVLVVSVVATLTPSAAAAQSELVIAKEKTRLYHRAACPVVADLSGIIAMTRAQAEARGYKAHADCDPANPNAPPVKAAPAPVTVYLDGSKYYHRKDCAKLKDVKTIKTAALEEAGKALWPCPACKPPRRERRGDDIELGRRRGR
jgi:hypothetical protein